MIFLTLVQSLSTSADQANPNPDKIDAAGCLIVTPHGFVMGINRLLNRLQLPVGRHKHGETAQQTAARETMEETGLEVDVGEIAFSLKNDRVILYFCHPTDPSPDYNNLHPTDRVEISRALIVNPVTMLSPAGEPVTTKWRYPEMQWLLRTVFRG